LAIRLKQQSRRDEAPPQGSGEIEGVEVDISSRIAARVAELHVRRGSQVKKGDVLVTLDCADTQAQLDEAEARVAAARAQAAGALASVEASRRQREAAAATQLAAKAQAEALAAQRDAALRQANRLEALANDVAQSNRDLSQASAENLSHQAQAAKAQFAASSEQARAAVAAISASGASAAAAEAALKAAEAGVARARLLAAECRLVAPRDGLVDEVPREVGELVFAGQPLVKLVDISSVKATFYLPNAELGAAQPGTSARVVADAWPNETFEGEVRAVSAQAEFTPRNIQTRSDRDRLVYPVEVWVDNPHHKLRPGMPVEVTLAQNGRAR
jgi:HlyD family secretion protein